MMFSTTLLHSTLSGYKLIENGVLTSLVTLLIICLCVLRKNKNEKSGVKQRILPGPGQHFLGSFANILAISDMSKCLKVFEKWAKEYGSIYQVNFGIFPVITLNSPEYVQKLLSSKNISHSHKGPFSKPFIPFLNDGLILSTGEKWKERRRVLNKHMFSFPTLQSYVTIFNEEGDNLVSVLGKMFPLDGTKEGKEIEPALMQAVLNVIAKAVFGKSISDFENMKKAKDEPSFTEIINKIKHIFAFRCFNPWLLYDPIWRLHPMSKEEDLMTKLMGKYLANAVASNDKLLGANGNKLGIQFDLKEAGISIEGILEESITLLSTGYETTSSSLHFALFLLALHPEHQELCREEVDSLFEDGNLCPSGNIQYGALSHLKYVEMCVNESLRLLPTVFNTFRKIEAPLQLEDDIILPAGSHISIPILGIHKNPEIYPEPNKFKPQRFSAEEVKKRHPYAHIPFGGGPRSCIGYKFAMMEMVIMIAKILRRYVITTTDKLEDVVFLPYLTLTAEKRMKFHFERRNFSNDFTKSVCISNNK